MVWELERAFGLDPFRDLRRLQHDMNRLFNGYQAAGESFPALNVWSSGEEALVSAELPGVDPKAVNITVKGDLLTLEGERTPPETSEAITYHRSERGYGRFVRRMRLPFAVDQGKVSAKYRDGILTVSLPRAEASKPKTIAVTAE
ncbi:MAG: Hsp20/alpha crystallin family protein [Kiritimatiellae bacterium]|nr:Hsp20/alpha crystallin family protein [Kiritimatiellia bacterium]